MLGSQLFSDDTVAETMAKAHGACARHVSCPPLPGAGSNNHGELFGRDCHCTSSSSHPLGLPGQPCCTSDKRCFKLRECCPQSANPPWLPPALLVEIQPVSPHAALHNYCPSRSLLNSSKAGGNAGTSPRLQSLLQGPSFSGL